MNLFYCVILRLQMLGYIPKLSKCLVVGSFNCFEASSGPEMVSLSHSLLVAILVVIFFCIDELPWQIDLVHVPGFLTFRLRFMSGQSFPNESLIVL